jgi:hypothetical protein
MFVLFAIATVASPRHGSQAGTGNCLSAGLAGAKRSMPDSSEGVLNCSVKPQVSLMQMDLKVRCGIRIRLVDGIALLAPSGWNRTLRFRACDISPHFSSSTRLYRSKSFLSISDFLTLHMEILDRRAILHP